MPLDSMIASLGAGTLAADPKKIPGGAPTLTHEDILAFTANASRLEFQLLMAKYVGDEFARSRVEKWLLRVSIREWFTNPAYRTTRLEAQQLLKLSGLAVRCWLNPQDKQAVSKRSRSAFIGTHIDQYRTRFEPHYAFLVGELGFHEQAALRAVFVAMAKDRRG